MRRFLIFWVGQFVSLIGTRMTTFALLVWLWGDSGRASAITTYLFIAYILYMILTPFGGMVVDRFSRKTIIIVSDMAAACGTLLLLILLRNGQLVLWHVYAVQSLVGAFGAFQIPAVLALITQLVPEEHYTRSAGLESFAFHASSIGGPALAGALIMWTGVDGILTIDLITFVVAVLTLMVVTVPALIRSEAGERAAGNALHQLRFAWRYVRDHKGLWALVSRVSMMTGLEILALTALATPMILSVSGETVLASYQVAVGAGSAAGALVVSVWGGPRSKVKMVVIGSLLIFVMGVIPMGLSRQPVIWMIAALLANGIGSISFAADTAIWQREVPQDVQGRVFAMRFTIAEILIPVAYLLGGPLGDGLANQIGLVISGAGVLGLLVAISGFFSAHLRSLDKVDLSTEDTQ